MHKTIRRFGMDGVVRDDSDFTRLRAQYEALIVHQMRDLGYVPVLDLGPYWSTEYDWDAENYKFILSVYGVKVGKQRAWTVEGISHGREIPRSTPKAKNE
jgi:hypothetical protein